MKPLLTVEDLHVSFSIQGKKIEAVRGISFSLYEGESVGIVGESGSGKSVAVQALLGLTSGEVSGKILFQQEPLLSKKVRGTQIGMVFQDPFTSLNPTMKIGQQVMEGILHHQIRDKKAAKNRALELLHLVSIPDPETRFDQYPHQLSGGMRQRILIAMAMSLNPLLLIADEPTTALDTILQAQILTLLKDLQKKLAMTLLLITHDFGVVAEICERVLVFHEGKIVEEGPIEQILHSPKHPYTQMLVHCVPRISHA